MKHFQKYFLIKIFGLFLLVLAIMVSIASRPPKNFPSGEVVHIPKNISLTRVSSILYAENVISSSFLFKSIVTIFYGQRGVSAGDYLFEYPSSVWTIASRMAKGDHGLPRIKVMIPEGSTVRDIAWILLKNIPDFNAPYFVKIAADAEGYLFPDTYFFYPNSTPDEIADSLRNAFRDKISAFSSGISLSGRKPEDIITMASIVEREAANSADRAIIAGILWKRLDIGMPLQVDVPLVYITANTTGYVSLNDTKIDSPYNTYKYAGLPIGPISNPGLDSLKAVLNPVKTSYLYYLSDKGGKMHYAVDHAGHVLNREKYLNK
ncbi:MAG: endolytic transglycosylase MltG [bacterium]|nr:endolytic transglycosylase MltG [bacterium]